MLAHGEAMGGGGLKRPYHPHISSIFTENDEDIEK